METCFYNIPSLYSHTDLTTLTFLSQVGWKYQDIVAALEAKRKVKGEAFHKSKAVVAKAKAELLKDAKVAKRVAPYQKIIESYGHQ